MERNEAAILDLSEPTDAPPGSSAKLEIMRARVEAGLPIFHPGDNQQSIWQFASTHWNWEHTEVVTAARAALAAKLEATRALQA